MIAFVLAALLMDPAKVLWEYKTGGCDAGRSFGNTLGASGIGRSNERIGRTTTSSCNSRTGLRNC